MKKVVVIGGGTGSYHVLKGLKKYDDIELTAIVNMSDDGGSTGRLRDEFGVLPPGDIRRCIVALSESTEMMKKLFQYRFDRGIAFKGHSFGNLLITALREITGSDEKAIEEACKLLSIKGKVLPVTLNNVRLCAELEDGQLIVGETNIDIPKHDGNLRIKRVFLSPKARAYEKAIKAINEADLIVIGPGDLYGSVVSNLIVGGIPEAIRNSKAKKVYICNLMTKFGETNNFKVHNFVEVIEKYLGKNVIDYVLYNKPIKDKKLLKKYAEEKSFPVVCDKEELKKFKNIKFIEGNFVTKPILARHDPDKIAIEILKLLQ